MENYYVTFYLQYPAASEEEATTKAEEIVERLKHREKIEEAVIVAVGAAPKTEQES